MTKIICLQSWLSFKVETTFPRYSSAFWAPKGLGFFWNFCGVTIKPCPFGLTFILFLIDNVESMSSSHATSPLLQPNHMFVVEG